MMEKQKALFYCRVNQSLSANAGVVQKCAAQIKALRNIGWTVDYFWLDDHGVYINEKQIYTFRFRKFKMLKFIYFFWGLQSLFRKLIKIENYDLFYFRYELSHPDLINTFKKIKNNNPLSFIVLEVPTFPYHLEKKGILRKIQYYIDAHFQLELKKYIDYIVHVGIQKKIFDIPTIRITNGLLNNPLEYSIQKSENGDFIQLVAIGTWAYWHGLDRLLLGFSEFKKQKGERQNIKLKIIGDGNIVLYKQTITNLGLANNVEILPSLPYKDMKEHLIQADIGIGTLAIFRKGYK
ncbi:MAG: glycosyltransferase [Saprospiraceae bacterium]